MIKKGIVIAGPTGVGKTALSIKLAKTLDASIISADSAQVYKEMNIGTAKITFEEMDGIVHHMLDVLDPIKKYSVGDYQRDVDKILKEEEKKGKMVILTGGTGLYINSITDGLSALPVSNTKIREEFMKKSSLELYKELVKVDPEAAKEIHFNNKKRVERALEVYILTGQKFSYLSKQNIKNNNYSFLKIALERGRKELYERINTRVDAMIKQGLEEEVRMLYKKYGEVLRKINIIGYSEFIDYFKSEISYEETIEKIKQNSRKYAKRQFTWFKNDHRYIWYNLEETSENEIVEDIVEKLNIENG